MPQSEVFTSAIVKDALQQRKQVFVPYIYDQSVDGQARSRSVMDLVSLHSKSDYERLNPDGWGIPTPDEGSIFERHRILEYSGNAVGEIIQMETQDITRKQRITEHGRLDLIVMPGVAFDNNLARLGHGKGFYDYFLDRYYTSKVALSNEGTSMPFLGM